MNGVQRPAWNRGVCALAWLAIACGTGTLRAGLNAGNTWIHTTPDGQYVLVMIAHGVSAEEEVASLRKISSPHARRRADEVESIRRRYSASGLYRNDGSNQPLWTTMYYPSDYEPHVSSDGRYLALASSKWEKNYGEVLLFCEDGKEIARWGIDDLLETMPSLRWRGLVRGWRSPDSTAQWSAPTRVLTLRTEAGEVFEFDATTGTLLRQSSPWPFYFILAGATPVLLGAGGLFGFVLWRGRRSRRRIDPA